ncbi:hypothetical protein PV325_007695, partial [Microctonus aethiopoides]
LVNCNDHSAVENYPRIFRARPVKNAYCLMCIERLIHWIVIGNDRLPHDPSSEKGSSLPHFYQVQNTCTRSWYRKCMDGTPPTFTADNWVCGECATILQTENAMTRSPSMVHLTVDQLLKPMDLSLLEANINVKLYGSTDVFMADAKWVKHNCIVFNTCGGEYADTSKLSNATKQIIKIARQEVSVIEVPEHRSIHINEIKLSNFKQILNKNNIPSEFRDGVLWCCNDTNVIRRQADQIVVEGSFSTEFQKIRELIYGQLVTI